LAIVASTGTAYNKPGKLKSDAYIAGAADLNGHRCACLPANRDVVAFSVIVGIYTFVRQSASQFQGVYQTAFASSTLIRFGCAVSPSRSAASRFLKTACVADCGYFCFRFGRSHGFVLAT